MAFLSEQAKLQGHSVFHAECNGAVKECSQRLDRGVLGRRVACLKCKLAGLSGYLGPAPDLLSEYNFSEDQHQAEPSYGAIATLSVMRGVGDLSELEQPLFRAQAAQLQSSMDALAKAARSWIKYRGLDAVFIYNGRIDLTNAVFSAARSLSVPVFSVERSWAGVGIQINAEGTPLDLRRYHEMVEYWSRFPLTRRQSEQAFSFVSNRFDKSSTGEFKQWNAAQAAGTGKKYSKFWVYLPSSIFERIGHPDWVSGWESDLSALELLISEGVIPQDKLLVRGHPQWSELTPATDEKYRRWCQSQDITYLASIDKVSTQELIAVSEGVIVNGSSTALEAGVMGKNIINLSPTFYEKGGFCVNLKSASDVKQFKNSVSWIESREVTRKCLRSIYTINYRCMQLTSSIVALNAYDYLFSDIKNTNYFDRLVSEGQVPSSDDSFSESCDEEEEFIRYAQSSLSASLTESSSKLKNKNTSESLRQVRRKKRYFLIDLMDRSSR